MTFDHKTHPVNTNYNFLLRTSVICLKVSLVESIDNTVFSLNTFKQFLSFDVIIISSFE